MVKLGYSRDINEDDIYDVANGMQSDRNTEIIAKQWDIEVEKKKPSFLRVLLKVYGVKIIIITICSASAITMAG